MGNTCFLFFFQLTRASLVQTVPHYSTDLIHFLNSARDICVSPLSLSKHFIGWRLFGSNHLSYPAFVSEIDCKGLTRLSVLGVRMGLTTFRIQREANWFSYLKGPMEQVRGYVIIIRDGCGFVGMQLNLTIFRI
jgi:hypothetical protein